MCLTPYSHSLYPERGDPELSQERSWRRQSAVQLLEKLRSPECDPEERLGALQHLSQFTDALQEAELETLIAQIKDDPDHRMRGVLCYALGLSGRAGYEDRILPFLCDEHHWVRANANNAMWRLHLNTHRTFGVLPDRALSSLAELGDQLSRLNDELAKLREALQQVLTRLAPPSPGRAHELMIQMQRDHQAYRQIEARLLDEHRGEFAVFAEGELVAVSPDKVEALQEAMRKKPGVRLYLHRIERAAQSSG